jgi:hypothetical protein
MKPLRPRLGAWLLAVGWLSFLVDRWMLPEGPMLTKVWITFIGAIYLAVALWAIVGDPRATRLVPWACLALGIWGMVAMLGLSADTSSSRTWMWVSVFSFTLGTVSLLVTSLAVDRRPSGGMIAYLIAVVVLGSAAWIQITQCRKDLNASWCDPRYEQEERILATLVAEERPVRRGHFGGALSPGTASFVFPARPDPLTAVVPRSAMGTKVGEDEVRWNFGARDDNCSGISRVQQIDGGHELRIAIDCRN